MDGYVADYGSINDLKAKAFDLNAELKKAKDSVSGAEDIPAEHMGITLDTYWVQMGGGNPSEWLEKFAGRVPCIHLKDLMYGQKMAYLGQGNINFDKVFKSAEAAGTKFMLVEQDNCNGDDPFDCLKKSYEFLKARGFE